MTNDDPTLAARLTRVALRVGAVVALHLGVFGPPAALLAQTVPDAEVGCGESEGPDEGVRLTWPQVPSEGASAELPSGVLTLRVQNLLAEAVRVRVTVGADGGGPGEAVKRFPVLRLPGGGSRDLAVDLGALGVLTPSMRFSGQVLASATLGARDTTPHRRLGAGALAAAAPAAAGADGQQQGTAFSPAVFFHRDPATGAALAYGGDVLRDQFAAGDLNGEVGTAVAMRLAGELGIAQRAHESGGGSPSERGEDLAAPTVSHDGPGTVPTGPGSIADGSYGVCVRWEAAPTDSGKTVKTAGGTTITEDYWSQPPGGGGGGGGGGGFQAPAMPFTVVAARGVRAAVLAGGAIVFNGWADPATGCFSFKSAAVPPFTLVVWTGSKNANENVVKAVDANNNMFAYFEAITPAPNTFKYFATGDGAPRATMAAIGGFAAYRADYGLTDKEMRLKECSACGAKGANCSSAHFGIGPYTFAQGISTVTITTGAPANAADGSGACTTSDHRLRKFIVTHEMGHSWLLLAIAQNSIEPNIPSDLVDPDETFCTPTAGGYSIDTLEWNSIGAREGIAHFYATEVFNDHDSPNAVFTWFGVPLEVEAAAPNFEGGRLWNDCSTTSKCGKATVRDWMKHWWDWHTPFVPGKPNMVRMRDVYRQTILDGGLEQDTYYLRMREALDAAVPVKQQRQEWDFYAHFNGIDSNPLTLDANAEFIAGSASGPDCVEGYSYPDCDCWIDRHAPVPAHCLGELGCPCADIDTHQIDPAMLADDSRYPDGEGSYAAHGANGPGQYCRDALIGLPDRATVCGLVGPVDNQDPVCLRCGVDTHFGCPCDADDDCGGLDGGLDLACWGATANGWAGSRPGICLPSASSPAGRERVTELPWFCLDNCGSKGSSYTCAYDQLTLFPPGIDLLHAQCVDMFCSSPVGFCELSGRYCEPEASCPGNDDEDWEPCCAGECTAHSDCDALGYPEFYVCDFGADIGVSTGHCVPPECATESFYLDNQSYCSMFW